MKRQIKERLCLFIASVLSLLIMCFCIYLSVHDHHDIRKIRSLVPNELNVYKSDAIPLDSLSQVDKEEYYRCLSSISEAANKEYVLEVNPLYMCYEYDGVYSEFFHSVTHINFGVLADYYGWENKTTYVPELENDYIEYYVNEVNQNQEISLLTGTEKIIDIISDNDLLLDKLYIPYMDNNLQMKTQKIRLYKQSGYRNIAVCYGQVIIDDIGVDNESGYVDEEAISPFTWRCIVFYVAPHVYDVIDIYRGISNLTLVDSISEFISYDSALDLLGENLPEKEKYEVRSIELVYSYYPDEFYTTDYLDYNDISWYRSYMFRPVWKVLFNKNAERWVALIDVESRDIKFFRVASLGY